MGKGTLALLGLLNSKDRQGAGRDSVDSRYLIKLDSLEMRRLRGREIALMQQGALASLNPALRIGTQIAEAWRSHNPKAAMEWKRPVLELFK